MLPQLIDPFPPQVKTLSLKSSHPFWNGHSIGRVVSKANATKKMRKIKRDNEAGLVDGTILMYHRYKDTDLQLPAVLTINWYKQIAMVENTRQEFREYFIKKLSKKSPGRSGAGAGISLINTKIGETDVELNISGNISVEGALVFEEKDLIILIDDEKVYDMLQFKHLMAKAYANDIKEFTIIRSSEEMNITATLSALPVDDMIEPYDDQNIDYEQIFISYEDSLNGFFIPKEMTLLFKVKVLPMADSFCLMGLTINEYDTTHVQLGECKTVLMVQEIAITDTTEVEILSGEHAAETGTILQETDEGRYDILLEDSTIVEGVDPSQVNRLEEQVYSGNYLYIKNVNYNLQTIQIYFQTDTEIAGFQFNVDGVNLISSYGGKADESGFMLSSSQTTTLGFSLTGDIIQTGEGTLVELGFENYNISTDNDAAVAPFTCETVVATFGCDYMWGSSTISASCPETCGTVGKSTICIRGIIVSDVNGSALDFQAGKCWIP